MWEPFSEPSRRAITRAQEVAQMHGNAFISADHITFALGEMDNEVGRVWATAVDRNALRERMGAAMHAPLREMVFTNGAKRAIELAFENARSLGHKFIGSGHIALGLLDTEDPPPLLAIVNAEDVREALRQATPSERGGTAKPRGWTLLDDSGDAPHPASDAILTSLSYFKDLSTPGMRVTVTIAPPDGAERTWTWTREAKAGD